MQGITYTAVSLFAKSCQQCKSNINSCSFPNFDKTVSILTGINYVDINWSNKTDY